MLTRAERRAQGEALRDQVPLSVLAEVPQADGRRDALELLHAQDASRKASLVPLR